MLDFIPVAFALRLSKCFRDNKIKKKTTSKIITVKTQIKTEGEFKYRTYLDQKENYQ
jgi:hypothetical protein